MQHQHSLWRQGWNTSPAEVNHKSSSKANVLVYNNLIQKEWGSRQRLIQIASPNNQFYQRIWYVEYYSVDVYMVWNQKFRKSEISLDTGPEKSEKSWTWKILNSEIWKILKSEKSWPEKSEKKS